MIEHYTIKFHPAISQYRSAHPLDDPLCVTDRARAQNGQHCIQPGTFAQLCKQLGTLPHIVRLRNRLFQVEIGARVDGHQVASDGGGLLWPWSGVMKTSRNYVKTRIGAMTIVLVSATALAANNHIALNVSVIQNVPTTSSYDWEVDGKATTTCYSSGCTSYFNSGSSGTANVQGAVLKLQLPDLRIVVAKCIAKPDFGRNLATALSGTPASPVYRNCRVPSGSFGSTIGADFNRNYVKLVWQEPSINGSGPKTSETYQIVGVLKPTSFQEVNILKAQIAADPDLKRQIQENVASSKASAAAAATPPHTKEELAAMVKAGEASRCLIITTPAGAEIDVDGNMAGKSPFLFSLLRHGDVPRTITIKMPGHVTIEKSYIPDGQDIPISVHLEQSKPTADRLVDGKVNGTPLDPIPPYRPAYEPNAQPTPPAPQQTSEIVGKQILAIPVVTNHEAEQLVENYVSDTPASDQALNDLVRSRKASDCTIVTSPTGAEIDIEDKVAGKSPLFLTLMRHDAPRIITVKMPGYVTVERTVVPDGKDISVSLQLEPTKP